MVILQDRRAADAQGVAGLQVQVPPVDAVAPADDDDVGGRVAQREVSRAGGDHVAAVSAGRR